VTPGETTPRDLDNRMNGLSSGLPRRSTRSTARSCGSTTPRSISRSLDFPERRVADRAKVHHASLRMDAERQLARVRIPERRARAALEIPEMFHGELLASLVR
jgi:hypothetical protein